MIRVFLLATFAIVPIAAGGETGMQKEAPRTTTGPALIETCACARICGLPLVAGTYWVDAYGGAHQLGECRQLPDVLRPSCRCPASPALVSVPRSSPNH